MAQCPFSWRQIIKKVLCHLMEICNVFFLHFSSTYRYTIICFESVQCLEITDYTGDDNAPTLPLSYWTEPPLSRLNREVKQNLTQGLHSDGNCSHVSDLWLYIVTDTRGSPTGPWVSKFWLQNTFLWRWKLLCFLYIYMHVYNFFLHWLILYSHFDTCTLGVCMSER